MDTRLREHMAAKADEITSHTGTKHSFAWNGNLTTDIHTIWCYTGDVGENGAMKTFDVVYDQSVHGPAPGTLIARVETYAAGKIIMAQEDAKAEQEEA